MEVLASSCSPCTGKYNLQGPWRVLHAWLLATTNRMPSRRPQPSTPPSRLTARHTLPATLCLPHSITPLSCRQRGGSEPVVLLHGLGVGLAAYISFCCHLAATGRVGLVEGCWWGMGSSPLGAG